MLLACDPQIGINNPPRLVHFNGYSPRQFDDAYDDPVNEIVPGERFEFSFEVSDPEGQDVRAWWPWAPAGVVLDPDERQGYWDVPEGAFGTDFLLILEDTHRREPRASTWWLPLWWTFRDTGG